MINPERGKNGSGGRNKFTLKMKRDSFKMLLMKVNKTTPVRSVLFRVHGDNGVREIHGIVVYCPFHVFNAICVLRCISVYIFNAIGVKKHA